MRKWLIILPLFSLLFLFLLFLPKIASTSLGKPLFVKALERKSEAQVQVESLSLSWMGPQDFHNIKWTHGQVTGTIEELKIEAPFWSFKGPFQLKNGMIDYKSGKIEQIQGQIEGNDVALTGVTQQGHISLKGKVYSKTEFNFAVDVKQFPIAAIDLRLEQALGPHLNCDGTIKLERGKGAIHFSIDATNLKTELIGALTNSSLTLTEPLIASLKLTPALSSLVLQDPHAAFASETAVTLRIEPKDFYFPLPFSLEKLKIGKAILDPGKIKCGNDLSLDIIMTLLKADSLNLTAWFTPVALQLDRGHLQIGRMDVLFSNSIHLCSWGEIDLIKNKLDLILGLPADTLQQAFGIRSVVDNYVLKIQVRGTIQEPEIVKGPAVAKIAALVAAGQIPKKGLLGELTDFFPKVKMDKDVPPPKRPFPWEKR